MADRYDLVTPRNASNGKTYFTKIGVMWPMKGKDGFSITLEALPLPSMNDKGEIETRILAMEPYKKDGEQQQNQGGAPGGGSSNLDDEIPFAPMRD